MNINTSLIPKFKIFQSSDGINLNIIETTGLYDINTNQGGYGTINPDVADVSLVQLTITVANGTYTFTNDPNSVTYPTILDGYLPDDASTNLLQIASSYLGQVAGTQLTDQIVTLVFTYTGTFNAVTFTAETTVYFAANAQLLCCYDKALSKASTGSCGCENPDEFKVKVNTLSALIKAYVYAAECDDVCNAEDLLSQAQAICCEIGCNC